MSLCALRVKPVTVQHMVYGQMIARLLKMIHLSLQVNERLLVQ